MFGGVRGGGGDSMEGSEWAEAEEAGVDGSDMEFGAVKGDGIFDSQVGGQRPCCADVRNRGWLCNQKKLPDPYICYRTSGARAKP